MGETPTSRTRPAGITAAIPTTGKRSELRAAAESALRSAGQAGGDAEVLVVVNGRADAPGLGGLRSPLLRVIYLPEANVSLARNAAIDAASHDTIVFTDDDSVVPPQWCAQLRDGLAGPAHAVVTGPVRMVVTGPVTGFLNYQRFYDSPPDTAGGVMYAATLNCGIRRDRLPPAVRFDETFRTSEDVDFGCCVREAGLTIGWLADAVPVRHDLPESLETISQRFPQYGAGMVHLQRKRTQFAVRTPAFHRIYQTMAGEGFGYRRFTELTQQPVRAALTVLEHWTTLLMLVGYLDAVSADAGPRLIEVDQAALKAACEHIAAPVLARAGELPVADCASPAFDYARFGAAADDQGDHQTPEISRINTALMKFARPADNLPPARQPQGTADGPPNARDDTTPRAGPPGDGAWAAWEEMRAADGQVTPDSVERCFRAAGVTFKDGSRQVEGMLSRQRL